MANVLIRQDKWDGGLLHCFLQGIHRVQFSFFKVTLAAGGTWPVVVQGSATGKRGRAFTDHCSGQCRGGSGPGSSRALIKGLPTQHCPLGPKRPCHLGPKLVAEHPPKELQSVSSCVHKKNKCGICHCLVCVLV